MKTTAGWARLGLWFAVVFALAGAGLLVVQHEYARGGLMTFAAFGPGSLLYVDYRRRQT